MPRRCCVPGCRSNRKDKFAVGKYVSCYGFPSDLRLQKIWLVAIGRPNFVPDYDSAVCVKHFDESSFAFEDIYEDSNGEVKVFKFAKPKLKNGSVPSIGLNRNMASGIRGIRHSKQKDVKVTVPLSRLINELELVGETPVIVKNEHFSDSTPNDEGKTCMDFLEVEMKDIESDKEYECGSLDLRIKNGVLRKRAYKKVSRDQYCNGQEFSNCSREDGFDRGMEEMGEMRKFDDNVVDPSKNGDVNFVVRICQSSYKANDSGNYSRCEDFDEGKGAEKMEGDGKKVIARKYLVGLEGASGNFVDKLSEHKWEEGSGSGNVRCRIRGDPRGDSVVQLSGQNPEFEKSRDGQEKGLSEVAGKEEWEGRWVVKEELFRGLGLVPRRVLHDVGRSVDRRHCVTERRRSEAEEARRSPSRSASKTPRSPPKTTVFYPAGSVMFDTEKFIGEIQRRPAIYDVRSKVYSNRVAKLKYWHEVGREMYKGWEALDQMERRTLVKELQIKWKSIRDHFMRQLKQNMNGEGPKKKKYVHFDQLQFLTANLGVKRPRHSYKTPKLEPEEEYMEFTPELPEERHFSFMTSVDRPDIDEHEVPVAVSILPQHQPEDLSYHHRDLSYHHKELSYHKELEGDRMGNKMFLLSLLPIMERLPDHANIRARLQLMEVLQTFVAHEDSSHRDFYNYHDEKQSCGDTSLQHSTASHSDSDT